MLAFALNDSSGFMPCLVELWLLVLVKCVFVCRRNDAVAADRKKYHLQYAEGSLSGFT